MLAVLQVMPELVVAVAVVLLAELPVRYWLEQMEAALVAAWLARHNAAYVVGAVKCCGWRMAVMFGAALVERRPPQTNSRHVSFFDDSELLHVHLLEEKLCLEDLILHA
jgi:hypothetical protein